MKNNIDQVMRINNIGIRLANKQQYEDALQCFQQSLSFKGKFLSENHGDLDISHANILVTPLHISVHFIHVWGQYDLAFEHYQKVLKVFSNNCSYIFKTIVYQNPVEIFYENIN